jgi:hypothetical protein
MRVLLVPVVVDVPLPEEHAEQVVRLFIVVLLVIMGAAWADLFLCAPLIIDDSLVRVAQTHESLADFLECLFRLRRSVLIRVDAQ